MKPKLVLVNPPIARYDSVELAPPLSLLTRSVVAERHGLDCEILDLNLPKHRASGDTVGFYDYVIDLVARLSPSQVGITSMGVNTHVAVELARRVVEALGCEVTLGGIHAASIASTIETLLPRQVRVARKQTADGGAWWNAAFGESATDAAGVLFRQVDVGRYFEGNSRRLANFEGGRGCKYRCAFCYSPQAHGRWQVPNGDDLASAFVLLAERGFRHVFLVEDNLTNSNTWLREFSAALTSKKLRLTWNGYATLPDLTPDVMQAAAEAGCTNLYLGIDAVERRQQRAWRKAFFRGTDKVFSLLREARNVQLTLTYAFILDLDPLSDAATAATLELAAEVAKRGADVRLSVITPYPQTEVGAQQVAPLVYSEDRAAVLFDLPAVAVQNRFAEQFPAAFPWHTRPAHVGEWRQRVLAVHAAQVLLNQPSELATTSNGVMFWDHCLAIARMELTEGRVLKTELKNLVRKVHKSLSPAA